MKKILVLLILLAAVAMFERPRVDVMGYDVPRPTRTEDGRAARPTMDGTGSSGISVVTYTVGGGGGGGATSASTVCAGPSPCTLTTPILGVVR